MFLQLLILLTGNYAFFNLLTLALCLWGLEDRTLAPLAHVLRKTWPKTALSESLRVRILRPASNIAVAVLIAVVASLTPARRAASVQPMVAMRSE